MDAKELAAIRERESKATPGPWETYEENRDGQKRRGTRQYPFDDIWSRGLIGLEDMRLNTEYDARECFRIPDVEFMAHARQDIPALLAYIEGLERLMGRLINAANLQPGDLEE